MPHADDQPEPPNPIQQQLNEFLLSNPLCVPITVAILSYFQNIRDVPRDGSCFYHCCMLFDITLPMTTMEVDNPLYCEKMAEYFGFWIGRAGLWTNAVIGLIEEATDRFLFSSSQGLEGLTLSCFLPSNYPQGPISQPISARSSPFHQQLFSGTVVDEEYTKYLVIWSCIHGATVV